MENKPEIPKSDIEKLKGISKIARARIEKEFAETANSWPACVGSMAFVLETMLLSGSVEEELGPNKYEMVMEKIENLKSRLDELFNKYPQKENAVPEETKEEVYRTIETITEGI